MKPYYYGPHKIRFTPEHWDRRRTPPVIDDQVLYLREGIEQFRALLDARDLFGEYARRGRSGGAVTYTGIMRDEQ
jgi:hypothetical protein